MSQSTKSTKRRTVSSVAKSHKLTAAQREKLRADDALAGYIVEDVYAAKTYALKAWQSMMASKNRRHAKLSMELHGKDGEICRDMWALMDKLDALVDALTAESDRRDGIA